MSRKDDDRAALTGFIETRAFSSAWTRLGLELDDLLKLQDMIAASPESGSVIRGGERIRKIRFALPGKGKSGGVRVVYALIVAGDMVILLDVFGKNEKANLSRDDVAELASVAALIKEAHAKRG